MLDATNTTAQVIFSTIERAARTYLIDDQPRQVHLADAADFMDAHPARGRSVVAAHLHKAGAQRAVRIHQLHDVMVVGGAGCIVDPTTASVFKNSFSSREQTQIDAMALERNLRIDTSASHKISGLVAHLCGQWSGNFFTG